MATQPITLHVPDELYEQLRRQAEVAHRTVEEEMLELMRLAMGGESGSPLDFEDVVAQLDYLNTQELWSAARKVLSPRESARLERLHLKRQSEGLSAREEAVVESLMRQYERALVVRARAIQLLMERGEDISVLAQER